MGYEELLSPGGRLFGALFLCYPLVFYIVLLSMEAGFGIVILFQPYL